MPRPLFASTIVIALTGAALVAGCSPANEKPSTEAPETSESTSMRVIAPVTVDISQLSGTTQQLVPGQVLNIVVPAEELEAYSPSQTPSFLEFHQGHEEASARFNPGFSATAPGEGEITLEGPTTITFTVTVDR